MKNLSFFNALFLALAIFGISSCGSDDTTVELGPTVSAEITSLAGANVAPGATFTVQVVASLGDAQLNSLTVKEAGANVDALTRILIDGIDPANNPQVIPDADLDGFTWDLTITAHTDEAEVEYTFEVADKNGEVTTSSLLINTIGAAVAPIVEFNGTDPVTVTPGGATIIRISATATSDIASIGLLVGGVLDTDFANIDYEGTAFDANPLLLAAGSTSLTMAEITIRPTATGVYTFEVTDANGLVGSVDVNVIVGTLSTEITGILLNAAGPSGTGGLDLESGTGVGSADGDIKDEGINGGNADVNWITKISAAGTATLKYAGNLPDGSGYADVNTIEGIQGAFDNSDDLSGGVSDVVVVGDEFVVESNGNYYFLLVTEVNVEPTDNSDNYVFSIKK
ncbi:MAG: hypothetical protein ACI8YQ_001403 [Polaribacter sp.]|jgi:hypothetical protein